jgi:predicted transcriptional regulator
MSAPERPDLFVVARILERLWRERGPMGKTKLQGAANVNYDVFTRYLAWLETRGLVERVNADGEREVLKLTRKGETAYRRLIEWIDEFVRGGQGGPRP